MKSKNQAKHKKRNIWLLGFTSFFQDMSSEMIFPILPIFLSSVLGANMAVIGLIEGIAESFASLMKFFSGWLSDKLKKRKPIIIVGYSISAISKPFLSIATHWGHVLAVRLSDRTGKGFRDAPRDALIADSTVKKERGAYFGLHRTLDTAGAIAGTLLAVLLLSIGFDFRNIFLLTIIPAVISVIILFFIKDIKIKTKKIIKLLAWREFPPEYKKFIIISAIFGLANFSYAFFLLRAKNLVAVAMIPLLYLVYNILYALVSTPAGKLADKIGKRKVVIISYILFAVTCIIFANITGGLYLWVAFAIYGIFIGVFDGVGKAYASELVTREKHGSALGVYHAVIGITVFPASLIGGLLWDKIGAETAFYYGAVLALIAGVSLILARQKQIQ